MMGRTKSDLVDSSQAEQRLEARSEAVMSSAAGRALSCWISTTANLEPRPIQGKKGVILSQMKQVGFGLTGQGGSDSLNAGGDLHLLLGKVGLVPVQLAEDDDHGGKLVEVLLHPEKLRSNEKGMEEMKVVCPYQFFFKIPLGMNHS